jgi:hypothetical protein
MRQQRGVAAAQRTRAGRATAPRAACRAAERGTQARGAARATPRARAGQHCAPQVLEVDVEELAQARALHLDHHAAAVPARAVHLAQRRSSDGLPLKIFEVALQRPAQLLLDDLHRRLALEGRHLRGRSGAPRSVSGVVRSGWSTPPHRRVARRAHPVLQLLQLLDQLRRQHVHARGELLANLRRRGNEQYARRVSCLHAGRGGAQPRCGARARGGSARALMKVGPRRRRPSRSQAACATRRAFFFSSEKPRQYVHFRLSARRLTTNLKTKDQISKVRCGGGARSGGVSAARACHKCVRAARYPRRARPQLAPRGTAAAAAPRERRHDAPQTRSTP